MKARYPEDLPHGLLEIAEVIGLECTLLMAKHVGGIPIYVPKDPQSKHKLAHIIGLPALRLLSTSFGGLWIEVPKYAASKNKKVKIKQLLKDGYSTRNIALQCDVTRRWVVEVAREMRSEEEQLSLFDL